MKVFYFIFSVYILLLSLAPCEEMMANVEVRFKETSLQTNFQSNETDESGDDCSPFCICSCCHFSTAYQFKSFSVTNKMTDSAILTPQDFYQSPYNQVFKASIWQPPKFNLIG